MNVVNCHVVALSLLAPFLLRAGAPSVPKAPLTVVMDFESPHSEDSLKALRHSLSHLLRSSGISVDVQLRSELPPNPQFGQLVVLKMKGSCSLSGLPVAALSDERGPLAMAYTSDGEVLHFGEVQCDRVRQSIQRVLGLNSSSRNQQSYGSALAVVIAHELYHMLGNSRTHTRGGLTKAALSPFELLDTNLALPEGALSALQSTDPAAVPPATEP